jgi:3',5'-cyclic AMP phosphodiesterase CpdA
MGFNKPANPDVAATLQATVDKINALHVPPDFIIHTSDLSHDSKAAQFDGLDQVLKGAKPKQVYYVPGEHDTPIDDGKLIWNDTVRQSAQREAAGTASITRMFTFLA